MTTLIMLPVTLAFCVALGIRPNFDYHHYIFVEAVICLISFVPVIIAFEVARFFRYGKRPTTQRAIPWFDLTKYLLILVVVSWIYAHIKAGVLMNGRSCDAWLAQWDRTICLGHDPVALARAAVPASFSAVFWGVYMAFKPVLMGSILWLILSQRRARARRLATALIIGYHVGVLGYWLLPSYGPAYTIPSSSCAGWCERTAGLQQLLLDHVEEVRRSPSTAVIVPWKYIGAFPSLHVSHLLILLWYFRYSRGWTVALGLFAAASTFATIWCGWHYLIDWIGGVAVAAFAVYAASWRPVTLALPQSLLLFTRPLETDQARAINRQPG